MPSVDNPPAGPVKSPGRLFGRAAPRVRRLSIRLTGFRQGSLAKGNRCIQPARWRLCASKRYEGMKSFRAFRDRHPGMLHQFRALRYPVKQSWVGESWTVRCAANPSITGRGGFTGSNPCGRKANRCRSEICNNASGPRFIEVLLFHRVGFVSFFPFHRLKHWFSCPSPPLPLLTPKPPPQKSGVVRR